MNETLLLGGAIASMVFGMAFMLIGVIGVVRFEDVFLRLQAASKCLTFGFTFMAIGAVVLVGDPGDYAKVALAILFQFLTAPVAAQMVARAGLVRGIRPAKLNE